MEGTVYYQNKLYVPELDDLRRQIIAQYHDLPHLGHPGINRTTVVIKNHYSWPNMVTNISRFVKGCAECAQMKINTHPTVPPLQPIAARNNALPFQTVSMDFITDLPLSNGFDSLMVVVDHDLTKGIVLIPCHKTTNALE